MLDRLFSKGPGHFILLTALTGLVVVQIVGILYPPVLAHVTQYHIFELIVLLSLLELVYTQTFGAAVPGPYRVLAREASYYSTLLKVLGHLRAGSVDILSAGISSRYDLIQDLVQGHIQVHLLIQDPLIALDKGDATRAASFLEGVLRQEGAESFLAVKRMQSVVSLRAILVRSESGRVLIGLLSWYTYDDAGKVLGHPNPTLVVDGRLVKDDALLVFAAREFDKAWATGHDEKVGRG